MLPKTIHQESKILDNMEIGKKLLRKSSKDFGNKEDLLITITNSSKSKNLNIM